MSNKCASAKSRISKRKRLNSDSRLSKHLPKLNETQVSEQERRLRRSNLSRRERAGPSVPEIASQTALAMTRAEQLRALQPKARAGGGPPQASPSPAVTARSIARRPASVKKHSPDPAQTSAQISEVFRAPRRQAHAIRLPKSTA